MNTSFSKAASLITIVILFSACRSTERNMAGDTTNAPPSIYEPAGSHWDVKQFSPEKGFYYRDPKTGEWAPTPHSERR